MNIRRLFLTITGCLLPWQFVAANNHKHNVHHDHHEHKHHTERRGHVHVHGVGQMNVSIQEKDALIDFRIPLDDLIGFEHRPQSDAEKNAALQMEKILNEHSLTLLFNPQAQCRNTRKTVKPFFQKTKKTKKKKKSSEQHEQENSHSEAHFEYRYVCEVPTMLKTIEVKLYDNAPQLKKIIAKYHFNDKQGQASLSPEQKIINLTP